MTVVILGAVMLLAFSCERQLQGRRDAVGSGTTDYRRAWIWATVTTLGSLLARFEDVIVQGVGTLAMRRTGVVLRVDEASACVERYDGRLLAVDAEPMIDALHYLSAAPHG